MEKYRLSKKEVIDAICDYLKLSKEQREGVAITFGMASDGNYMTCADVVVLNKPNPEDVFPPSQKKGESESKKVTLTIPSVTISGSAEERAIFVIADKLSSLAREDGLNVVEYMEKLYLREKCYYDDIKVRKEIERKMCGKHGS